MQKTLMLLRHAHAQWQSTSDSDHERTLSARGEQEAKLIGKQLKQQHILPQLIICSSAERAKSTLTIASQSGEWACPISIEKQLYNTDTTFVLSYIQKLGNEKDRIMLVGHEPTWSDVSNQLINDPNKRIIFSTAMLLEMEFEISSWSDILPGTAKLNWIIEPH